MILLSELSRRRIRSINKLVRVGRDECAVVVRVDQEKGYIDLSKRRLSDEEKVKCANKFEKVCSSSCRERIDSFQQYFTVLFI